MSPLRAGLLDNVTLRWRSEGLYGEGDLENNDAADAIVALLDRNRGAWSTGTLPYLLRARSDGFMEQWPLVEASVLDRDYASSPPGSTTAFYVRGVDLGIHGDAPLLVSRSVWMFGQQHTQPEPPAQPVVTPPVTPTSPPAPSQPAPVQQQPQTVDMLAQLQQLTNIVGALAQRMDTLPGVRQLPATQPQPMFQPQQLQMPTAPQISIASPYDGVSLLTLLVWDNVLAQRAMRRGSFYQRDETIMRSMVDKVRMMTTGHAKEVERRRNLGLGPSIRCVRLDDESEDLFDMQPVDDVGLRMIRSKIPNLRSDEALQSTLAGSGDEWVPTLMNSVVYYYFMTASRVAATLKHFVMPSNPFDYPTIKAGVAARRALEPTDRSQLNLGSTVFTSTKPVTAKVQFNLLGELAIFCLDTDFLLSDAAVNVADILVTEATRKGGSEIDYLILNADERATTSNISHLNVDPTGTAYDKVLLADGLRVIADANSDSAPTSTLADTSFVTLQKLMGTRGIIGLDIQNLVGFVDPGSAYKLNVLAAYDKLQDVGPQATLLTGQLGALRGVPVIPVEELEAADSAGKVVSTHDGTLGQQVIVHRDIVTVGRGKDIPLESGPIPFTGMQGLLWRVRLDVKSLEAGGVARGYNSTIT